MPAKKDAATATYEVVRDCAVGAAGDTVQLTEEDAALLVRDGMIRAKEA